MTILNGEFHLPFEHNIYGSITLELEVGNSKNMFDNISFLYDTGATNTVLTSDTLELLGYDYNRLSNEDDWKNGKFTSGLQVSTPATLVRYTSPIGVDIRKNATVADGSRIKIVPVTLTSIKVAGVEFKNFPVYTSYKTREELQAEKSLPAEKKKRAVNLLGTDLLKYFQQYIDFDNQRVVFNKRSSFEELLARTKANNYYAATKLYEHTMIHSLISDTADQMPLAIPAYKSLSDDAKAMLKIIQELGYVKETNDNGKCGFSTSITNIQEALKELLEAKLITVDASGFYGIK